MRVFTYLLRTCAIIARNYDEVHECDPKFNDLFQSVQAFLKAGESLFKFFQILVI